MASSPGWVQGYVPPATEWNNLWASKADVPVPVNQGGTGQITSALGNYALQQRGLVSASPATLGILTTMGVRTSLSPFTLNLPALSTLQQGDWIILYDADYNAGVNNITIVANGADKISLYSSSTTFITINVTDAWVMLTVNVSGWRAIVRLS